MGRGFKEGGYRLKLLFCIKSMNTPGGGAERVLAEVTSGLAARGHEIGVLSFDPPGGRSFYSLDQRIKRIELGVGSTRDPATVFSTVRRIKALRSSVRTFAPEVAIGFMHSMFIPLGFALAKTSIPMIASEHIVPEHYRRRPVEAFLLCFTPLVAKSMTCVSEQAQRSYPKFLARKMYIIPNPVNVETVGRADVRACGKCRKLLLAVGRLEPQKDHVTLIKAFSRIADKFSDWDLRIVGDGRLKKSLEALIRSLGLGLRVSLPGAVQDISKEYLSAQLFAQPSRYESFGLTTAEALAHGLPAVGFDDCQGINQLIQPGINGYLASGKGDRTSNLANALMILMQDSELRAKLARHTNDILDLNRPEYVITCWEEAIIRVAKSVSG